MFHKFKKFVNLKLEEKILFFEAFVLLGIMRFAMLTMSFKRLTQSLNHTSKKEELIPLSSSEVSDAIAVGQAIHRASCYTPWKSACLVQSLVAQNMLKRRAIKGQICLGVVKHGDVKAHAWTECGDIIVTGNNGHKKFTILSVFGW
jgi:hypothetical protein